MFCRNDQILVCVVCCMDQHEKHKTVTASTEAEQRRRVLRERKDQFLKVIEAKEKDIGNLAEDNVAIRTRAEETEDQIAKSVSSVTRLLGRKRSKWKELVMLQRDTELSLVQAQEDRLNAEISKLRRSMSELETLETTADPCHFLQNWPASCTKVPHHEPCNSHRPSKYGDFVAAAVSKFADNLKETIKQFSPPEPEPTTTADFLYYAHDITMDPGTAHPWLSLWEEQRAVTLKRPPTTPPDRPNQFNHYRQVLSREALSGRCYWEVEWSGRGGVRIALSYSDIQRKGNSDACAFGYNNSSWALDTSDGGFSIWFNKQRLRISAPLSPRVGVYLDQAAGLVSFYSVSQTMSLLHRLHTSFSQPLHVGVWFYWGYSGDTVHFLSVKNNPSKLFLSRTEDGDS